MKLLLDANVLIALVDTTHEHHRAATTWAAGAEDGILRTCPTVENAMVRYLVRTGLPAGDAHAVLDSVQRDSRFGFVKESVSLRRDSLTGVVGFRQVTDVYLCQVARGARASLATFDRGLTLLRPDDTQLVPAMSTT